MAWPHKYESGVTLYDKEKAFTGYTLFTCMPRRAAADPNEAPGEVFLMDMQGNIVHTWNTIYPPWYARLMPDGHLVVAMRCSKPSPRRPGYGEFHMGGATGMLMELDWDSTILFSAL